MQLLAGSGPPSSALPFTLPSVYSASLWGKSKTLVLWFIYRYYIQYLYTSMIFLKICNTVIAHRINVFTVSWLASVQIFLLFLHIILAGLCESASTRGTSIMFSWCSFPILFHNFNSTVYNFGVTNWLGTVNLLDVGVWIGQFSFNISGQSSSLFMANAF